MLAALFLLVPVMAAGQSPPGTPPAASSVIADGATVQLEYTLTDGSGAVLDSNKGQKPLVYTQGGQQIIPGLEKQLAGLHTGDEKKVTLKPEEAYGPVDPAAQTEVPKDALPADALVVGTTLLARNAAGESRPVVVKEVKDQTVVLDLNHPLAGKTLVFDVKVLSIDSTKPGEAAKPAESPKADDAVKPAEPPKAGEPSTPTPPKPGS
jgi:FKBP-type peptidyl-prolyl cis-trans isomerase 2